MGLEAAAGFNAALLTLILSVLDLQAAAGLAAALSFSA